MNQKLPLSVLSFSERGEALTHESCDSMNAPTGETPPSAVFAAFLATNSGAQRVGAALKNGAEVAIQFCDQRGEWRIYAAESGEAHFEQGKATDPDFELYMPTAAVCALAARTEADVGELGITFFEHISSKDPARRIGVKIHSGIVKLTRRGWLGVLALGGPKVMMWMAGKGLRGRGAIANALSRFKG
jgi:hypothetical protein